MSAFQKFKEDFLQYGLEWFGLFYGTYEGIVVDNDDKENRGRLIVKCPAVWGEDENVKIWALPKGVYAGKKTGFHAMPENGDVVWITFRGGKPEYPIWEYGWWLKDNVIELAKKGVYVIATPKGHTFVIDENNEKIFLSYKDGKAIEINKTKISLGTLGGSSEKAALGDTLKQKLDDLCTQIENLCAACEALVVVTPSGNSTAVVNIAQFQAVHTTVTTLKGQLDQILSDVVTLD